MAHTPDLTIARLNDNDISTGVDTLVNLTNAEIIDLENNSNIPCEDLSTLITALSGVVVEPTYCY